ncbi:MAG: ATP phosphoribosyltransferase regulatory subunit [Caldicoprobacterales bacterium]|nr:ATP phosphoribosyltransferase regulatory subunit [Clostridiales bacterium]
MSIYKGHIPEGLQDCMPEECFNKRRIENIIRRVFFSRGYDEIETPVFEYLDVFTNNNGSIEQDQMLKIVGPGNHILVMRPDMTTPIARLVATRFKDKPLPIRLSYLCNVYRYQQPHMGKQWEITQAGIELMGIEGPEADAEVVSTAIQCFLDLGLKDFQIDIGQVEFFNGLIEEADIEPKAASQIRVLIEEKNILALKDFLNKLPISIELKDIFMDLPKLYGNIDIYKIASRYARNSRCQKSLQNIIEIYDILKAYGFHEFITLDLGMVHNLNYYTGIIFRVFTKDLGFPICGGGRYDKLLSEFGYDIPATGFAINLKNTLMTLERQKGLINIPSIDILVVVNEWHRKRGYYIAQNLRRQGKRVEIFDSSYSIYTAEEYAKLKGISQIIDVSKLSEGEVPC